MTDRRCLIVTGGVGHPGEDTSAILSELFAEEGIASEVTDEVDAALESLAHDQWDLLAVNALRWRMLPDRYAADRTEWAYEISPGARAGIESHVAAGRGIFGAHTACICFDDWPRWGQILGGHWDWERSMHPPLDSAHIRVEGTDDPLLEGLSDFDVTDEVYGFLSLEPDVTPLLTGSHSGAVHPLFWRHRCGPTRVVYDALGHDARSYEPAAHCHLVRRAVRWAATVS